jgi:sensor histidine kinase YesM
VATLNRFPMPGRWQYMALAAAVLASATVGIVLFIGISTGGTFMPSTLWDSNFGTAYLRHLVRFGVLGALFATAYAWYRNEARSAEALHRTELAQTQLDAQMDEARLQVLQAQIEPHFLFNTLANVKRLYQTDQPAGTSMLDNLMRYLAVALPQMRTNESTLGREATLAEAYLNIQKIRMGRRLAFEIAVPEALRPARMPPVMLVTLVENAIKHGLNPLPEGGFIRIAARAEDGRLEIEVGDTGAGFAKSFGGGTGLANIRARLATMYGADGRLAISLNKPRGVTMTLTLPHVAAPAAAIKLRAAAKADVTQYPRPPVRRHVAA